MTGELKARMLFRDYVKMLRRVFCVVMYTLGAKAAFRCDSAENGVLLRGLIWALPREKRNPLPYKNNLVLYQCEFLVVLSRRGAR